MSLWGQLLQLATLRPQRQDGLASNSSGRVVHSIGRLGGLDPTLKPVFATLSTSPERYVLIGPRTCLRIHC